MHLKHPIFIYLCIALLAWSCEEGVLLDQFHEVPNGEWQYDQVYTDSFTVLNPDFYHQIYVNLRISSEYKYANIQLLISVTHPDGKTTKHELPIKLAEKSGKWLGKGLGDILTYQVPILHRKFLDQKGMYSFKIAQNMRVTPLKELLSVGIKVQQQEEIY